MHLSPFSALHPPPDLAQAVGAVPYDTVDTAEAAALAAGNPNSFLHVSRSEIDMPQGTDPHSEGVYAAAARAFVRFQREGVFLRQDKPQLYIYRISIGAHVQTGVVGCCHAEEYEIGIIRRHEKTRPDKENDRLKHMLTLRAHTGPIYLTYRDDPAVDRLVTKITAGNPWFTATAEDGAVHAIWPVEKGSALVNAFKLVPLCYIADGHHRAAAAARAAAEMRKANPTHTGNEEYNLFMSVLFPASQLRILAYNRCVHDLNGMTPHAFLRRVREVFTVSDVAHPKPANPHEVSMLLQGCWYGLKWEVPESADTVARLDVSVLQDRLLGPILGIEDPRTSSRIEFVGGIRGTDTLASRVADGRAAVAFSMYPPTVEDMMDIADAGQIMPPKSTWFEPKLRSGLLVHTF